MNNREWISPDGRLSDAEHPAAAAAMDRLASCADLLLLLGWQGHLASFAEAPHYLGNCSAAFGLAQYFVLLHCYRFKGGSQLVPLGLELFFTGCQFSNLFGQLGAAAFPPGLLFCYLLFQLLAPVPVFLCSEG